MHSLKKYGASSDRLKTAQLLREARQLLPKNDPLRERNARARKYAKGMQTPPTLSGTHPYVKSRAYAKNQIAVNKALAKRSK